MSDLTWDDDDIDIDEEVSEEDIKNAESMGKVAVGRYFCECVGSEPKQKDFANYSCIAANLRWEIQKVLEMVKLTRAGQSLMMWRYIQPWRKTV
jgi:hypothetical protein